MNKYWSGLVVAGAMAFTVSLAGQAPQNPANTPPPDAAAPPGAQRAPAPPSAQTAGNTVTISGCVQNAPASSTATAGGRAGDPPAGAGAAATAPSFVLANASMKGSAAAPGAVGTTGAAATSYKLEGNTSELSQHLNHEVEITGAVQSSSASPTGAERAAPGSTAAGPTLKVTSVKMISATCPPASPGGAAPPTAPKPPEP